MHLAHIFFSLDIPLIHININFISKLCLCHVCITLFYISIVHNSQHSHPNILILINHLERSNIIKVFHDMKWVFFYYTSITVQLNIKNMNFYNEITWESNIFWFLITLKFISGYALTLIVFVFVKRVMWCRKID